LPIKLLFSHDVETPNVGMLMKIHSRVQICFKMHMEVILGSNQVFFLDVREIVEEGMDSHATILLRG
jgi:hypothetical protein